MIYNNFFIDRDPWPCSPEEIRVLVNDMRVDFPPQNSSKPRDQLEISPPQILVSEDGTSAEITFTTDRSALFSVELGTKVPVYGTTIQGPANGLNFFFLFPSFLFFFSNKCNN